MTLSLVVMAGAVASVAGAQPPDGTEPVVPAPPPAPEVTTTTITTTTTIPDDDMVPVQPPISDGSEIPDPPAGSSPGAPPGGPNGGPGSTPPASIELERSRIAARISSSGDALAVARDIEAAASAELDRITSELDEARREYDLADRTRREAEASTDRRREAAELAASRSVEAGESLQQVAIEMYVDPPQEMLASAALTGRLDRQLAARGLLTARSELAHRAADDAARAEDRAAAPASRVRAAAEAAASAAEIAEGRLASLEAQVAERADRLRRIATTIEALRVEVDLGQLGAGLLDRFSVEQVTYSGSVLVTVTPDGSWSVLPVGFPAASEIVRIPGTTIRVHRLIAANVSAMIQAAASAGVRLDGWGHRDSLRQVELRRAHCGGSFALVVDAPAASCRPPTARPGRSMHERGLAIDFATCSTRSTPCYQWLSTNAGRFGLLNLPTEPWHWSTNGR